MRPKAKRICWGVGLGGLGLALALGLPSAQAQRGGNPAVSGGTDRVMALVEEARASPCFQAPTRPMTQMSMPASVAAAAMQGDAAAMLRVAEAYLADPARGGQALAWLERAALAGLVPAAAEAASMHAAGRGTPADDAAAAAWWTYGATRGETRAMACLSAAYLLGRGLPQDTAEAARWAVLRETRGGGSRGLLRPALPEFERALPGRALSDARRQAREVPEPSPPPAPRGAAAAAAAAAPQPAALARPPAPARLTEAGPPLAAAALLPTAARGLPAPALPSAPPLPMPAPPMPALALPIAAPIAAIVMPPPRRPNTQLSAGSGVVVGAPDVVVTSAHVVEGCLELEVQAGLARLGGVQLRALHDGIDLALLTVPGLSRRPVPVASQVRLGAEVMLFGFPRGALDRDRVTVTAGNVSAMGAGARDWMLQFTAPTTAGNSGGPLVDRRGQVVGIVFAQRDTHRELLAGLNPSQNVNFAVTPAMLTRFLEDHGVPVLPVAPAPAEEEATEIVASLERSMVSVVCQRPATARPAEQVRGQR